MNLDISKRIVKKEENVPAVDRIAMLRELQRRRLRYLMVQGYIEEGMEVGYDAIEDLVNVFMAGYDAGFDTAADLLNDNEWSKVVELPDGMDIEAWGADWIQRMKEGGADHVEHVE